MMGRERHILPPLDTSNADCLAGDREPDDGYWIAGERKEKREGRQRSYTVGIRLCTGLRDVPAPISESCLSDIGITDPIGGS